MNYLEGEKNNNEMMFISSNGNRIENVNGWLLVGYGGKPDIGNDTRDRMIYLRLGNP